MKNNQNIAARNLFISLAQKETKNQSFKAGLYLLLASKCKTKQNKDGKDELLEAAKLYLKFAKKYSSTHVMHTSVQLDAFSK